MNKKMLAAGLCSVLLAAGACQKTPDSAKATDDKSTSAKNPGTAAKTAEAKGADSSEGVRLTPEQMQKIGLETEAVKTVDYAEETAAYGSVIPHVHSTHLNRKRYRMVQGIRSSLGSPIRQLPKR